MRALALTFFTTVLAPAQQAPVFRANLNLVHIDAEVADPSGPIAGFHKDDFRILDNDRPQPILYFSQEVQPLDLILLFDTSGSMRSNIEKIAASSYRALAELRPGDRVAVMTFDFHSHILASFTDDLLAVPHTINDDVLAGRFGGATHLLAAIDDAAKYFLREPRTERRRAILILTDNYGQRSRRTSTVVHHLWDADTILSGLLFHSAAEQTINRIAMVANPLMYAMMHEGMRGVAEKTGGDSIQADDPGDAFRDAMRRIRLRYSLYYQAPPAKPGQQRQVQVDLSADAQSRYAAARVRARKGYLAQSQN